MPTKKKLKKRIERLNKIIDWYADRLDELEAREIEAVLPDNNALRDAARSIGKLWGHNLTGLTAVEEGDIVELGTVPAGTTITKEVIKDLIDKSDFRTTASGDIVVGDSGSENTGQSATLYDWSKIPEGYDWAATDSSGCIFAFMDEPGWDDCGVVGYGVWVSRGKYKFVGDAASGDNHKTSLEKRPDPIQAPKPRIPPCRNYENYGGTEDD